VRQTRRLIASLIFVAVLVALALLQFATGSRPLLGLDLEGGVRVVLDAPAGTDPEVIERAAENIRERVDALGVAEPDLFVSGESIEVQIPGTATGSVVKKGEEWCVLGSDGKDLGCLPTEADAKAALQATGQQRLIDLIGTTARLEQREVKEVLVAEDPAAAAQALTCATDAERLTPECSYKVLSGKDVWFAGKDGTKYHLGPVEITGEAISRATAILAADSQGAPPTWRISFELNADGARIFSEVTKRLTNKQLAIILDQVVLSAPNVEGQINGSGEITGDFEEQEARDLATNLNAGSLPVELTKSTVETVSATLGAESLKQGLLAGLFGLLALMVYLAFYYRILGLVTWVGMAIWAILALGIISFLGKTAGYSLSLAGVAGLIVSLGVTADSYIVFFERLKDEVRSGRTPRAAVQPAFAGAWHTIIAADVVTLLAAGVLYLVAISSVRGFALTLGLSVLLDMFVVYFFKRPTVFLMARSPRLLTRKGLGFHENSDIDPAGRTASAGAGR